MALRHRTSHVIAIAAFLLALHGPVGIAAAQNGGPDWVTGFPRETVRVAAWPGGKKVAVSFALFVEQFGFGQGPVIRPDLTSRNPDLTNEAFRQYGITFGNLRVGRLFNELGVPRVAADRADHRPWHQQHQPVAPARAWPCGPESLYPPDPGSDREQHRRA